MTSYEVKPSVQKPYRPAKVRKEETYRQAYSRGFKTSENYSDGALERADARGESDAWYDGYMDSAAGRPKWHLEHCTDRDEHRTCWREGE